MYNTLYNQIPINGYKTMHKFSIKNNPTVTTFDTHILFIYLFAHLGAWWISVSEWVFENFVITIKKFYQYISTKSIFLSSHY